MSSSKKSRNAKAAKAAKHLKHYKERKKRREQQRVERLRQEGFERLKRKVDATGHYDSSEMRINPEGEVKMSEVLGEFVAPYIETTHNQQQYENMLGLAVIAWNLSFLPQDQQSATIQQVHETTSDPEAAQFYCEFLARMIQRKYEHFAGYDRMIVDFTVIDAGDEYRVTVASTMPVNDEDQHDKG